VGRRQWGRGGVGVEGGGGGCGGGGGGVVLLRGVLGVGVDEIGGEGADGGGCGDREGDRRGRGLGGGGGGAAGPFWVHEWVLDDGDEAMATRGGGPADSVAGITGWVGDVGSGEILGDGRGQLTGLEKMGDGTYVEISLIEGGSGGFVVSHALGAYGAAHLEGALPLGLEHVFLVLFGGPSPPVPVFLRTLQPSTVFLLLP
jgi:hypothetical protein